MLNEKKIRKFKGRAIPIPIDSGINRKSPKNPNTIK
jgi:hypothetical protein